MREQFSVRWDYFVNVFLHNGVVLAVKFSDRPVNEMIRSKLAEELKKELKSYFSGEAVSFSSYEVDVRGFTAEVLEEVRKIPYGKTTTYGEIAKKLSTSPRAVGQALKRNPAPVIIPCHRVVSRNGIGGYSSGEDIKRKLLALEGIKLP